MAGPAWVEGGGGAASTTLPFTNQTSNYTVDNLDCVINCTSGTFTVTLPTAVGIEGQYYIIKNSGTGVITIDGNGSETIDGTVNRTLSVQYESMTLVSNGVNWIIV
jgi:hypothetical protein